MSNEFSLREGPAHRRVLIVEDDKLMWVFYERLFKSHARDLDYHLEENAEGALDYLRENRVDAIITDWDLPGVNGINLLKALRSHPTTKALPIMMVSGRTGPGYMDIALKNGASDYFSKPFDVAAFLDRIRSLLRGAGGL
ncbi:MAG: response regulator [Elusimicrobia bacterium]|nr:response regulator [Elusimicrobiota bacterium]